MILWGGFFLDADGDGDFRGDNVPRGVSGETSHESQRRFS